MDRNGVSVPSVFEYKVYMKHKTYIEDLRVHTGPGNREKVGDFKQAFSRPGIAGKLSILGDWSGNRQEF